MANDHQADHRQHGEQRKSKSDIEQKAVEGCGNHHDDGNAGLQENGCGGRLPIHVQTAEYREEKPVFGHGVVDPGPGHNHGAQNRQQPQGDRRAENPAQMGAEKGFRRFGADFEHAFNIFGGQCVEVDEIQQQIEDHHDSRASEQRKRDVALRVGDLRTQVSGGIPSAIGKGDENQGNGKLLRRPCDRRRSREMGRTALAYDKPGADEGDDQDQLEHGQPVLHAAAHAQTVVMDHGEDQDHAHGGKGRGGQGRQPRAGQGEGHPALVHGN
ncbi:hypothetical protein DESC_180072 [Desulfosarcina cetonica]|nr:hypothetical protein DESC_180072 [Desulfosarcina cetonica]